MFFSCFCSECCIRICLGVTLSQKEELYRSLVEELFGHQDDMEKLFEEIVEHKRNLLISAVGGLGKTELVKGFLSLTDS